MSPSLAGTQILHPEKSFTVYGEVKMLRREAYPLAVVAISDLYGKPEIVGKSFLFGGGYFSLYLPEGNYSLIVLSDLNADSLFKENECIGFYRESQLFSVNESQAQAGIIGGVKIYTEPNKPFTLKYTCSIPYPLSLHTTETDTMPSGSLRALDDTLFSNSIAQMGIYDPAAFLSQSGIYFYTLDQNRKHKEPVIFVHGYGGSPREFMNIVKSIDSTKYTCWFFYYPSGQSLEKTASIFYELFFSGKIINIRQKNTVIIAHSMGGLVVRRALNMYSNSDRRKIPITYISLCTPYGGNDEASKGIKNAPVSVASWYDIASTSNFITNLTRDKLHKNIRFYLLFGYKRESGSGSESSDGTIVLRSQLYYPAQQSAESVCGFNETHESILYSNDVTIKLRELMEQ